MIMDVYGFNMRRHPLHVALRIFDTRKLLWWATGHLSVTRAVQRATNGDTTLVVKRAAANWIQRFALDSCSDHGDTTVREARFRCWPGFHQLKLIKSTWLLLGMMKQSKDLGIALSFLEIRKGQQSTIALTFRMGTLVPTPIDVHWRLAVTLAQQRTDAASISSESWLMVTQLNRHDHGS